MSQQITMVWTTISHAEYTAAPAAASHPVPLLDDMICMQFQRERKEVQR
jgi:hypothetical protein